MGKIKVAIISSGIPTQKYPLEGIFAFDQAKALASAGVEIVFLSIDLRSIRKKREFGFSSGVKDGIRWFSVSLPIGPIWFIHKIILKPLVVSLFKKAFKDGEKPDLIHAHFAGSAAYILGTKYKIPYVITEHNSEINKDDLPPNVKDTIKLQYQNAARVLAVSSVLSKRIKNHSGVESIVVPNIIDTHLFLEARKRSHEGFRLVTTSNLIPLKRTKNILQVLPDIIAEYNDVKLDIIGEGVLKGELMEFVKSHGLENNVEFHGLLTRDNISKIYEVSDCFILPSSTETFGVAYVEAMAAGLPVIATKCGGPEDFVDELNGIMIEVDDMQQLKDAILYMYKHYKDYDAQAIKTSVTAKYSPEVVAKEIIAVYNEILN